MQNKYINITIVDPRYRLVACRNIICTRSVLLSQFYSVELRPYIYSLERSNRKLYVLPKPVQRYWAKEMPSIFEQVLVIRTIMYQNVRPSVAPLGSSGVQQKGPGTIYTSGGIGITMSSIYCDWYLTYTFSIFIQFFHSFNFDRYSLQKKLTKLFESYLHTTKLVLGINLKKSYSI